MYGTHVRVKEDSCSRTKAIEGENQPLMSMTSVMMKSKMNCRSGGTAVHVVRICCNVRLLEARGRRCFDDCNRNRVVPHGGYRRGNIDENDLFAK
jgi:hypothetical protein